VAHKGEFKMGLLKNLELVNVEFENDNKKAVLTFLDEEHGEVREINFNKQSYDDGKYVDDPAKAIKVDEWCKDIFNLTFDTLAQAIGERKDVYTYDNFNSLFEVQMIEKFSEDMLGQIISTKISEIVDDGKAVRIRFEYEGKVYEGKMTYSTYMESRKQWFVDPQKRIKQYAKFEKKFHVPVTAASNLIGADIMVEIKKAMGKWIWNDIKAMPKPKK